MHVSAYRLAHETLQVVSSARATELSRAARMRQIAKLAAAWNSTDELIAGWMKELVTAVRANNPGDFDRVAGLIAAEVGEHQAWPAADAMLSAGNKRQSHHEDVRSEVRSHIYAKPGRYIAQLHEASIQQSKLTVSYSTVRNVVNELEADEEILTVGARQGSRRLCFPHFDRVRDPKTYYGDLWCIRAEVGSAILSYEQGNVLSEMYETHAGNRDAILITPRNFVLHEHDTIEVIGRLVPFKLLAEQGKLFRPLGNLPDIESAIFVHRIRVKHRGGREELVESPEQFLAWDPQLVTA